MLLRDAVEDDVPDILGIYNHVIATSTAVYTGTHPIEALGQALQTC